MGRNSDDLVQKWTERRHKIVTPEEAEILEFFDLGGVIVDSYEEPLEMPLNADSTAFEVCEAFGVLNKFNAEITRSRVVSPDWISGAKMYVEELKESLIEDFEMLPNIARRVFQDVTRGLNQTILEYAPFLVWDGEFKPELVSEIAHGTCTAVILPRLMAEIEGKVYESTATEKQQSVLNSSNPDPGRLKWIGTHGELGAIVDLLMDAGYIEDCTEASKTARMVLKSFSLGNDKEPSFPAFRQCFKGGESKAKIFSLKIPPSSNKGKI